MKTKMMHSSEFRNVLLFILYDSILMFDHILSWEGIRAGD